MTKDIDFKNQTEYNLLTGLNYYSQNFDFKDSKTFALDWIKIHLPNEYERLKDEKETKFSNRGFVCRMMKNGLHLSDEHKQSLINFFTSMPSSAPETEQKQDSLPKRKSVEKINTIIFQMEDVIDAILSDEDSKPVQLPVDKSQLSNAQIWLESQIIDAQEQLEKQKKIINQLINTYERCGGIKEKIVKPVVKSKTVVVNLNEQKAKVAKTVTYQKKDEELGIESLSPARIVGAKMALVYNSKYRNIMLFVAKAGETLIINGSSIRNHDEEKSVSKKIRKPKDFFAVENKWKAFELLKTAEQRAATLISANTLIISIK